MIVLAKIVYEINGEVWYIIVDGKSRLECENIAEVLNRKIRKIEGKNPISFYRVVENWI